MYCGEKVSRGGLKRWRRGRLLMERGTYPGVDEPREIAQATEGDVDEGVGAAKAAFDPDYVGLAS